VRTGPSRRTGAHLVGVRALCEHEGMADPTAPLAELSEDECWALLVAKSLGRLALSISDQPEIFPVNYHASSGSILFRTAEGTKLFGMVVNRAVAFEVDDHDGETGWSVVAKGRARVLVTESELAEAEAAPLRSWSATVKRNFVRIDVTEISGRRIMIGEAPDASHL
jgi:nitroimidazol reductase NimA-like FMN-containing flavoprotein (pyridoxamine 5'-phosphate oxidase superfamily)